MDNKENKNEDSVYSYSYVNGENKNPDQTWRASENTASSTQSSEGNWWRAASSDQQNQYKQENENVYSAYQAPKKERRFRKEKNEGNNGRKGGFGVTIGKCVALAAVFGLVAGAVFNGTNVLVSNYSDDSSNQATVSSTNDTTADTSLPNTGTVSATNTSTTATTTDVSEVVANVMPSIVAITNMAEVTYQDWFGQTYTDESQSSGSGVIISQDEEYLYIATNNHVVEGAASISVGFIDETTATAEVKGTDSSSDLAVVSVPISSLSEDTLSQIKVATLGNSDELQVGESSIAIGNALGYGQSVTTGVISALNREVTLQDETTGESITNELIQTDAAINPGNSGGALLNTKGEVIGINSAKYASDEIEGMGFAIPISSASPVLNDLITREAVDESKSAYLGISGLDVTSDVAGTYSMPEGVFVAQVYEGTAAAQYGIVKGDIITSFDGKEISSMQYLSEQMAYYESGTEVEIVLQRASNGVYEEHTITVTLGAKSTTNTQQSVERQ